MNMETLAALSLLLPACSASGLFEYESTGAKVLAFSSGPAIELAISIYVKVSYVGNMGPVWCSPCAFLTPLS